MDLKPLTMVPAKLVDGLSGGGGNPKIRPTEEKLKGDTLTPEPPAVEQKKAEESKQPPKPLPEHKQPKPTSQKADEVKPAKMSSKDLPRVQDDAKKQPRVDLTKVVPRPNRTTAKKNSEAEANARTAAADKAAKERALATLKSATERLRGGFASGTVVDVGGPGGEAYADYKEFVRAIYDEAWMVSDQLTDENATAEVTVVIARTGEVISAQISRRSANPVLDKSVQRALDKVTSIGHSFPEGAKESRRTFIIEFNLKTKRAFG
ncbi:MAG: hypothetical protein DME26_17410 [Verrucomicrobia bacterium]|nr:MAG: hypothetical protein DME26_17410 [Verrucomicrobiota bacterium]